MLDAWLQKPGNVYGCLGDVGAKRDLLERALKIKSENSVRVFAEEEDRDVTCNSMRCI